MGAAPRNLERSSARIALLALLASTAPAQERAIVVQNLAPLPREEWLAVSVPFAAGKAAVLPDLHVKDVATVWQPFGARWPDGSLRQALCLFRAAVPALGEVSLPLVPGPGPELATGPIAPPACQLEVQLRQGEQRTAAVLAPVELLEDNAARRVALLRARVGKSGLVAEAIVTFWRAQAHAAVDLSVFFSDPGSTAMQCNLDELAVESRGMACELRCAGLFGIEQTLSETGSRAVLLRTTALGDGQGIRRCGALLPRLQGNGAIFDQTLRAAAVCPLLGATAWTGTLAFGAFGHVPDPPPWLSGSHLRMALAARHRAFTDLERRPPRDPFWCGPFGLERSAGQTGDQQDFGTVKLSAVAYSGLPSLLLEAEASVLQEACRPVHCFEENGVPVLAKDHPQWVVWSGRTHWHGEISKDRLGKPVPEPPFESHGWTGKDREHWSSNSLGAFALLTGSHWARRELQNEVQLYLAGETIDPGLSTSGSGAPRGAGRTELAACWMYLATGDEALRKRMNERVDRVHFAQWAGRELGDDRVRPMAVQGPDDRMLQGKVRYWTPWQDAICATGFAADFLVIGNEHAKTLAEELALNVVRHGFKLDDKECIVATAMRWQDGVPLSPEQYGDPTAVLWSYGTDFNAWSLSAVAITAVVAERRGDKPLQERAETILRRVRQGRRMPQGGFYDRLTEWEAVRW